MRKPLNEDPFLKYSFHLSNGTREVIKAFHMFESLVGLLQPATAFQVGKARHEARHLIKSRADGLFKSYLREDRRS